MVSPKREIAPVTSDEVSGQHDVSDKIRDDLYPKRCTEISRQSSSSMNVNLHFLPPMCVTDPHSASPMFIRVTSGYNTRPTTPFMYCCAAAAAAGVGAGPLFSFRTGSVISSGQFLEKAALIGRSKITTFSEGNPSPFLFHFSSPFDLSVSITR